MPRYFFNVRDHEGLSEDDEGVECPDVATACREADLGVRELLAEAIKRKERVDHRTMEVTDESGAVVARIVYREILTETAS
jgi:hypothetical protein